MNKTQVLYVGNRPGIRKPWKRKFYSFRPGQAKYVPDDFAEILLKGREFVLADEAKRPVTQRFPNGGKLLLHRWGPVGDLLMFRAAVAAFQREIGYHANFQFTLRCAAEFMHLFEADRMWRGIVSSAEMISLETSGFDDVVSFDQVAEADHRGDIRHRLELFLEMLTDNTIEVTPEDWYLPAPGRTVEWVRRHLRQRGLARDQREASLGDTPVGEARIMHKPLVAVQVRGSRPVKSLPRDVMAKLINALLLDEHQFEVILIENYERETAPFMKLARPVHTMCNRDALHSVELLRHCDLAITMDSGALWMAHCAPCPVLAILGPTRPAERISRHPLGPEKARAVCLNETVQIKDTAGCDPCFESMKACGGSAKCMQKQPSWDATIASILKLAKEIIWPPRVAIGIDVNKNTDHGAAADEVIREMEKTDEVFQELKSVLDEKSPGPNVIDCST